MFWFFGHPEVYIMILPAFGIVSEVLPVFARKPIFGYHAIAFSTIGIAFVSMLVWAHHMFTVGMTNVLNGFFMIASVLVVVPTGVKVINWLATLWRGNLYLATPMLFALGLVSIFTIGGLTGVMIAAFPFDWQVHDTYFIVAHMHYVLFGGAIFGIFAGLYYVVAEDVRPDALGQLLGKWNFWLFFIGMNLTFGPQHFLGLLGMPRRVSGYPDEPWRDTWNVVSSIGSFLVGLGFLVFLLNVIRSRHSRRVGNDPWLGDTLEWYTTSPPPEHNFDRSLHLEPRPLRDLRRRLAEQAASARESERLPSALRAPRDAGAAATVASGPLGLGHPTLRPSRSRRSSRSSSRRGSSTVPCCRGRSPRSGRSYSRSRPGGREGLPHHRRRCRPRPDGRDDRAAPPRQRRFRAGRGATT